MRPIGKNIKELRLRKNMTQDALASMLHVSRQTVSNYETGKSQPDIDMLTNLAQVLDCEINHIIYGTPTEEKKSIKLRKPLFGVLASILCGAPLLYSVELHKLAGRFQSSVTMCQSLFARPLFLLIVG